MQCAHDCTRRFPQAVLDDPAPSTERERNVKTVIVTAVTVAALGVARPSPGQQPAGPTGLGRNPALEASPYGSNYTGAATAGRVAMNAAPAGSSMWGPPGTASSNSAQQPNYVQPNAYQSQAGGGFGYGYGYGDDQYGYEQAGYADGYGYDAFGYGYEGLDGYDDPQAAEPNTLAGYDNLLANDTAKNKGSSCGAGGGCDTNCCDNVCCTPFWAHRTGVNIEGLFLRPGDAANVAYAVPQNGTGPTAVPFGAVARVSPNYSFGVRGGFQYALTPCSSIALNYTYYQTETNSSVFANPPLVIHSLVTHPATYTAASDSLAALAREAIRYQFADADYLRLLSGGRNWFVNYSVGARYANLAQLFRESQPIGPGVTNVGTNINFDGAGSRVGLQGMRKAACSGLLIYGNSYASVLVGSFRANYQQVNSFTGTQVWSTWKDFRAVPILEYELGGGWQSKNGRLRLTAGYYFAVWFNTVSTGEYIQSVQTNNYVNRAGSLTFNGLTARLQYFW